MWQCIMDLISQIHVLIFKFCPFWLQKHNGMHVHHDLIALALPLYSIIPADPAEVSLHSSQGPLHQLSDRERGGP